MVELVDIEKEWNAIRGRFILPAHCCLGNLRHDQRAEEMRVLLADTALRKFGQKNLLSIHDAAHVEAILLLRDHVAYEL